LFFFKTFNIIPPEIEVIEYSRYISNEFWISAFVYFTFFIILTNVFIQIDRKFGPGNFGKIFLGKYHLPHEEDKIFLFIDLKNSTTIAETLGHKKYSQFIRECFHDLTDIVFKYNADIYQYVGDEIVLCWHKKDGFKDLNCIKSFFSYENQLEKRKNYYLKNYETFPEFKGGMDEGKVTVTEIGDIKRDIAYHGDVLNTAARIQEKCNEYNERLIISEHIFNSLKLENGFSGKFIGNISLRGKKQKLELYAVQYHAE
jgi:adenylate cyclase